jgi:hypothetical protein
LTEEARRPSQRAVSPAISRGPGAPATMHTRTATRVTGATATVGARIAVDLVGPLRREGVGARPLAFASASRSASWRMPAALWICERRSVSSVSLSRYLGQARGDGDDASLGAASARLKRAVGSDRLLERAQDRPRRGRYVASGSARARLVASVTAPSSWPGSCPLSGTERSPLVEHDAAPNAQRRSLCLPCSGAMLRVPRSCGAR